MVVKEDVEIEVQEAVVTDGMDEEAKRLKRQRLKSLAIGVGLAFLVVLFYLATIVRMGN